MTVNGRSFFALVVLCLASAWTWAHPTPSAVPTRWELNFEPGDLRLFYDPVDQSSYWYFTYTITNRTGRSQIWAPRIVLFTDAGEIMPSGTGVPRRIVDDLLDLLGNPLLMNQFEVIGPILQGREHAKEGLAVWPAERLDVTEIKLFISGLSGETARVSHPGTGEEVLLRKTLERTYLVPGNAGHRGSRPLDFQEQRWIFR